MANKWKITLSDGSVIDNLTLNGNNFVSETELTVANFDGKMSHVIIEAPDGEDAYGSAGEHAPMMLAENRVQAWPDGYYFVLLDIPVGKLREIEINSRLDYIEMMEDL